MKIILVFATLFTALLMANDSNSIRETRTEIQIKKEIEKEKKFAKEQTFYLKEKYDLKRAEVNMDSVDSLPDIEIDDFDMDSVYD